MQFGRDVTRFFGRAPKGFSRLDADGWISLTGEAAADLNMCFVASPAGAERVAEYVDIIRPRGVDGVLFAEREAAWVSESADALGLTAAGEIPLMERGSEAVQGRASGAAFRRATKADVPAANQVNAQAFGTDEAVTQRIITPDLLDDGVDIWVAEDGSDIVGTGAFVRTGDHVGIYMMSTRPTHQRRGVGRALLDAALAHYIDEGAARFTLEATPSGRHLYEQAGFVTVDLPTAFVISHLR